MFGIKKTDQLDIEITCLKVMVTDQYKYFTNRIERIESMQRSLSASHELLLKHLHLEEGEVKACKVLKLTKGE